MEALEVLDLIDRAEDSKTQLKQNFTNAKKVAEEMVAFSNAKGGVIIIGVNNQKDIVGLSDNDIDRINQLISNASDENVRPPITPLTEVVKIENKKVLIVQIEEGTNKPYATKDGIHLTKVGADKRRLSQEQLQRLFQDSYRMYADEQIIHGTSVRDIEKSFFEDFYEKEYEESVEESGLSFYELLKNLRLADEDSLKLGGLMLFGRKPTDFRPSFLIKAVNFYGSDPSDTDFKDSEDIKGRLSIQFENALGFILRNIHKVQIGNQFNQPGEPEIPRLVLEELLVNALIHRDYYINAPITLFVFKDRIELTSPGKLPNNLAVEHIKRGVSVIRNPIVTSFGSHILPYRGVGTGVRRALKNYSHIEFDNDIEAERFKVIIKRPKQK